MASIKRVAIFAIPDHHYINMMLGLKRGFEQLGVEAFVSWPHLSGTDLNCFVDNFKPDIILEMDRFRDQIPGFDDPVRHVAWVLNHVVHRRRVTEDATGSFAVYMTSDPKETGFDHLQPENYGYLPPACDPVVSYPRRLDPFFDFTLIGHMYGPLLDSALDADISVNGRVIGRIRDLVDAFVASDIHHWNFDNHKLEGFILDFFERRGVDIGIDKVPPNIRYVIDEYMVRLKDRKRVADGLLSVSQNVGFFGNPEWKEWAEFEPYYYGTLHRSSQLSEIICRTRLNIHNGPLTMHMRVMEVLGCGMPLLVNRSTWDKRPFGIEAHFTPYEHYIPYALDEIEEVAAKALRDEAWRLKIAEAGYQRVLEAHTWRHRAAFLLDDLGRR